MLHLRLVSESLDQQVLPAFIAAASLSFLLGQWVASVFRNNSRPEALCLKSAPVNQAGSVRAFRALKVLSCATLVALQIKIATSTRDSVDSGSWESVALCITYAYATFLACIRLSSRFSPVSTHLNIILLASFASYAYRDLFPLGTFPLVPKDLDQGRYLWAKIFVLFIAAVVLPLSEPRSYIALDPNNPMEKPNVEQTCSLFSSLTYSYLDPLILKANKQRGLSFEELPVIADHNRADYLIQKSFPALDPLREGASTYLLYGLFRFFRREYLAFFVLQTGNVLFQFASPVVINRLLASLESENPFIRPWVWVALLFFAPFFRSMCQARYTWLSTRQKTQGEGILLQLLFAHSLRVRMNSEAKDSDKRNLIGRINNLATSDLKALTDQLEIWITVVFFPLQVTLAIWFLYAILGWSSLVGLAVILITLPIPLYLSKIMRTLQQGSRKKTDARVQQVTEAMNVLRMIKWFSWESKIQEDIAAKRDEELRTIRHVRLIVILTNSVNFVIPLLVMLATFSVYTLVMKRELTASIVFSSLAVFDGILRQQIRNVMNNIPVVTQAKVSADRLDEFLRTTELIDSYSSNSPAQNELDERIGFRDAQFSWSSNADDSSFKLRVGSEITFQPHVINLVVGPTGVGKTATLLALLGEMHFSPAGPDPWVNLPRAGGVAFAAQQPWLENATIKQNIVFDTPFDESRYKRVLHACALYPDLELLEARDETEIGERGLTLSGGQKARVSLARAIYSSASIVLLDDILSSLDIHTSKFIVQHCFSSDLVRGRTVIFVTHNIALTHSISQWVVSLNADGSIVQGPPDTVVKASSLAIAASEDEQAALEEEKESETLKNDSKPKGKLMVAETTKQGMVKWPTYKIFLANLSSRPISFVCFTCGLFILNEATTTAQFWFLGYWSSQYLELPASSVPVAFYLGIYSLTVVFAMMLYISAYSVYAFGTMRSAKVIHSELINSVVGSTLRWLDTTPMSRVITRVTQDMSTVDTSFALLTVNFTEMTIFLLAKFTAVMILNPAFIVPGALISFLSVLTGRIYMVAQLPIQRQMSAARSPMLAHFAAAISGLTSIRAYGAEEAFLRESMVRIDGFIRPALSYWNLNRWITLRSDTLGGIFSAGLGWYLVYGGGSRHGPANVGFSLSAAVSFTSMILWWVRSSNGLQLSANNLERVVEYLDIEQEPKPTPSGVPPAYWPASGEVRAENLSARYSDDGPEILHNLDFTIKSGERVAIIGRTGSGKSSLTLSLLRAIPTEGRIYYDTIGTDALNLDALRSNITIIPQVPELLGGTLRRNLDPFEIHDDAGLNDALRAAGLFSLQSEGDGVRSKLTLNSVVSSEGGNLSLGERQIVALARAIVRRTKLIILDEATSAIDYKTDAIIQATLRNELQGATVMTVAHRLNSVMDYDRIMVLDAGRIIEFDTPANLLKDQTGRLRAMVDESSDRDHLLAMAGM
ncbi:P-loop containing nucleoside triphosphate hydrolase protein [Favolaschia claudopus]|uniref:P-loop containing nucleoside triphosphate hydrolase protein n=1 Tax=Favolaschia claudopus TaxID=2862362 RepID=A0AAW0DBJ0_9AGAR